MSLRPVRGPSGWTDRLGDATVPRCISGRRSHYLGVLSLPGTAHALGPVDFEIGAKAGGGTNPGGPRAPIRSQAQGHRCSGGMWGSAAHNTRTPNSGYFGVNFMIFHSVADPCDPGDVDQ